MEHIFRPSVKLGEGDRLLYLPGCACEYQGIVWYAVLENAQRSWQEHHIGRQHL